MGKTESNTINDENTDNIKNDYNKIALKYPVLLVHGMGFRDHKYLNYWGRIPKALESMGCKIYYGGQDSSGTIESNAAHLKKRILEVISETRADKINVIAHSKGGLDVRYAISTLGMADYVASLTTMSTPHNGSKTVDLLLKLPDFLVKIAGRCCDLCFRFCGDKNPDAYHVFQSFTTDFACKFNQQNKNDDRIYYQSYAFVMNNSFSDIFMFFTHLVVKMIEGENDGLLTPAAVKWGEFRGTYTGNGRRGISHCDEVDMRRMPLTKKSGDMISDMPEFYKGVVEELVKKGF